LGFSQRPVADSWEVKIWSTPNSPNLNLQHIYIYNGIHWPSIVLSLIYLFSALSFPLAFLLLYLCLPLRRILSLGYESATLIDIYDATSTTNRHPLTPDDGSNDETKWRDAPWFCLAQLRTGFVWLFQLVVALIVQVTVMAADIVALKTRITEVEGAQIPAFIHDEILRLHQAIDTLQRSMACQVSGVKMDASSKITLLQLELTAIREELASVQMVALPVDISAAAQAVKEARMTPILTSTAQRTDNGKTKIGTVFSFRCDLAAISTFTYRKSQSIVPASSCHCTKIDMCYD
jgi:hypothetical protein